MVSEPSDIAGAPAPIALEVHDLSVAYGRKPVLWAVDTAVPSGSLTAILGPNGAGKSTLLKAALGLVERQSGYTRFYGQPLEQVRQQVAYVPQRETVDWDFPIDVRQVVMMGRYGRLGLFGRPSAKDKEIVAGALEQLGLTSLARRQISQLSGGQQQRVFIARALAQEARLYLLDEPFAGVDRQTERTLMDLFRRMTQERGATIICVHHDLHTVAEYFDHVLMVNTRLLAAGPVNEVYTSDHLEQTFGARLTILTQVAEQLRRQDMPMR